MLCSVDTNHNSMITHIHDQRTLNQGIPADRHVMHVASFEHGYALLLRISDGANLVEQGRLLLVGLLSERKGIIKSQFRFDCFL